MDAFLNLLQKTYSFFESSINLFVTEAIAFRHQKRMEQEHYRALKSLYTMRSITLSCISRCKSFHDSLLLQEELEMTSDLNMEDLEEFNQTIKEMNDSTIYFQSKANELTKMIEQLEVFED